jgi:two-component system chemotaxis response regulator CheB
MEKRLLRIVIADDSSLARGLLRAILEHEPDIEIVGEASNGQRAIDLVRALRPSLITMDLEMPVMSGLEAIAAIMSTKAVPILVVSSITDAHDACEALRLGALDVVPKPDYTPKAINDFIAKVRLLADMVVVTRWRQMPNPNPNPRYHDRLEMTYAEQTPVNQNDRSSQIDSHKKAKKLFAIAASTGGPQALTQILPHLPRHFPATIIIAQHIAEGFAAGLADWLGCLCSLPVRLAEHGELLQQGFIYVAPSETHLTIIKHRYIWLCERNENDLYRPSCDALFASLAQVCATDTVGIILTGMGHDGVSGLKQLHTQGGIILAQDEASSVIYGMNRVAIEAGVVDHVLPLNAIADEMLRLTQ